MPLSGSQPPTVLFTLPISSGPSAPTGGTITCTQTASSSSPPIYTLTFTSPPDNRLTQAFLTTYLLALNIVERRYLSKAKKKEGVLVSTSGIAKFFSNGLDLKEANATPGFWSSALYPLMERLITYPIPTLALINGHAWAGGFALAMCHDYRISVPTSATARASLCMNEIAMGVPLPPPLSAVFRAKTAPGMYRAIALEGRRLSAEEGLEVGVLDALLRGGVEDGVSAFVEERKLASKASGPAGEGAWGMIKEEMYKELLALLRGPWEGGDVGWFKDVQRRVGRDEEKAEAKVREWESKAKL